MPWRTRQAIVASCTTPTLCVLVSITGPSSWPDSSIQAVPVISPVPFSANQPANTGVSIDSRPRGRIAVTPVRTLRPSGEVLDQRDLADRHAGDVGDRVERSGDPSNGTPRSRARGPAWAMDMANAENSVRMLRTARKPVTK